MQKRSALLAFATLGFTVPADAATFLLDLDVGGQNVTGFIETDGTIGVLSVGNIVNHSFSFAGKTFTPRSAGLPGLRVNFNNSSLVASSTALTYDFTSTNLGYALFWGYTSGDELGYLCFQNDSCYSNTPSIGIGYDPRVSGPALTGRQTVAVAENVTAAVPEPGTWLTLILGFFAIGASMRWRKTKQTVSLSYA